MATRSATVRLARSSSSQFMCWRLSVTPLWRRKVSATYSRPRSSKAEGDGVGHHRLGRKKLEPHPVGHLDRPRRQLGIADNNRSLGLGRLFFWAGGSASAADAVHAIKTRAFRENRGMDRGYLMRNIGEYHRRG